MKPPSTLHATDTFDVEASSLGFSLKNNFKLNAPYNKIVQKASQRADVSAVRYKSMESRDPQISLQAGLNRDSVQEMQEWQEKVKLSHL